MDDAAIARPVSGFYAEASAGPAFAAYGPQGDAPESEHLASTGSALALGGGYGFELGAIRLDLGLRVQHFRIRVAGRYDAKIRDDAYRANYDYVFPTITMIATTKFRSRVNLFGGLSLGTATFLSDKQGGKLDVEQIPIFGTFEGGLQLTVVEWLDLRATVAWLPPFEELNIISTSLGFRARF